MKNLFRYRSGGKDQLDLIKYDWGLCIEGSECERGSCDLPDQEAIRLAIALIQATPGDPLVSAERMLVSFGSGLLRMSHEEMLELGTILIRAAQVKR